MQQLSKNLSKVKEITLSQAEMYGVEERVDKINEAAYALDAMRRVASFMLTCRCSIEFEEYAIDFAKDDNILGGIIAGVGVLSSQLSLQNERTARLLNEGIDRSVLPIG